MSSNEEKTTASSSLNSGDVDLVKDPYASGSLTRSTTAGNQCWRIFAAIAVTCLLISQTGCQLFQRFTARPDRVPVVFEPSSMPSQQQLIATLNANSSRVRQLQSNISLSMDGIPKIKGTLQLERPDRLRIKAGFMGMSDLGVDVGSNSDLFWVWTKIGLPGQSPSILYAHHEDYQNSLQRAAVPLEPQWIIDAAGLVEFSPDEVHQGPFEGPGGRLKLHSIRQTPAGPLTRVSIIDRKSAQIYQQSLYDQSNRLIAYSNSSKHQYYADERVSLPHWIELHVFSPDGQEVKLIVEAGKFKINSLYGDPDKMWTMPQPEGVPAVDLTRMSSN